MTDKGFEILRHAIVLQACIDFNMAYFDKLQLERKSSVRELNSAEINKLRAAKEMKRRCLEFFRGHWYAVLCEIPPEKLIRKLKTERKRFMILYDDGVRRLLG